MNSKKPEVAVLLFTTAVAADAILLYGLHRYLIFGLPPEIAAAVAADPTVTYLFYGLSAGLAACVLFGMLIVLPLVSELRRDNGALHSLAGMLQRRSREMEFAAQTDVLTGLHNRRYFDEALNEFLTAFDGVGRPLGLLLLDLDHFKAINDTHGHDVGDRVLADVGKCLRDHTRFHDVAARIGGEEFALIVPNMTRADLHAFAERLRRAIERLSIGSGNVRLRITTSVGLAVAEPNEDAAAFLKRVDTQLYRAKQTGRNRICA